MVVEGDTLMLERGTPEAYAAAAAVPGTWLASSTASAARWRATARRWSAHSGSSWKARLNAGRCTLRPTDAKMAAIVHLHPDCRHARRRAQHRNHPGRRRQLADDDRKAAARNEDSQFARPPGSRIALWLAGVARLRRRHRPHDHSPPTCRHSCRSRPTNEQQLLLDQLRDGLVSRLILVGIEGADAPTRAALSKQMAPALRADPAFVSGQQWRARQRRARPRFPVRQSLPVKPGGDACALHAWTACMPP